MRGVTDKSSETYPMTLSVLGGSDVMTETSKCPAKVVSLKKTCGPVDQSGMIAALAQRKPGVQIPLGPPS